MSGWPPARRQVVTVDNELYEPWDDRSSPTIRARQSVPPLIAGLAVPPLGPSAGGAIREAVTAVGALRRHAAASGGALGHLSAVLIRADALASSQIEDITTSSEALAVALADLSDDEPNFYPEGTELVAANVATALHICRADEPVTAEWFQRRHRSLLDSDRELLPRHLGAWRDCAVWIGRTRQSAVFEGPPYEQVPALMDDLVRFVARSDVHQVVHAALAHAQFETIHPYADGNGRVGRLLIHALLDAGEVPVPVAHGLLHDPAGYVAGLTSYRDADLDTWVTTFAAAVSDGAAAAVRLVDRINALHRDYRGRLRTPAGSSVARILDSLVHTPAITAAEIQAAYRVTRGRASQILRQFAYAGILRLSDHRAGRAQVWVAHEVIAAVDRINATIPRRLLDAEEGVGVG